MKNLLCFILLCYSSSVFCQSKLWTRGVPKGTIMSQLESGKILLMDNAKITLLNNISGEIEWENKIPTKADPEFLIDLPIMFFEGKSFAVINTTTGYVIDQSIEKTTILGVSYFWNEGFVVLEMKRNNNLHILNINLKDLSKSWNTIVGPANKRSLDPFLRLSENPPILTKDGSLIILDKKYIAILGKDGQIYHKLEFNEKLISLEFNLEKNILYVKEGKKKLHFIDVTNGIAKNFLTLKNDDLILNILGHGATISLIQNKEVKVLDAVTSLQVSNHTFEDKIKATYIEEESGGFFVLTKKTLSEIDHASGKIKKSTSFDKNFNAIYHVFGKTIISGPSGASPIDLKTLTFDYPKIPDIPRVHDYVEIGDYVGYIFFVEGKFVFSVVDRYGEIIWKKKYSPFYPPSLDVIGDGLLIVSETEVTYLTFDGESIWNDEVKVEPSFTYGVDEITNNMYMYSDKRLYKFDYSSGTLARSQAKFKFKDFDYELLQPQLFVLEDAIFMKGSNTVFVLEKDGTLKYEKTYKRISSGSTILDLASVLIVAVAIGTGNASEVVTVYSDDGVYRGGMVDALDLSWDVAEQMKYKRRIKQNRSSNFFPYVFTKLDNGKRGLIFINPATGEERFSIEVNEKNPAYLIDDIDGALFHLSKGSLTAFDLK